MIPAALYDTQVAALEQKYRQSDSSALGSIPNLENSIGASASSWQRSRERVMPRSPPVGSRQIGISPNTSDSGSVDSAGNGTLSGSGGMGCMGRGLFHTSGLTSIIDIIFYNAGDIT